MGGGVKVCVRRACGYAGAFEPGAVPGQVPPEISSVAFSASPPRQTPCAEPQGIHGDELIWWTARKTV